MTDKYFTIDEEEAGHRLLEMSVAISYILPIWKKEHMQAVRAMTGTDLAKILPSLFSDLGRLAMKKPVEAMSYINWLKEACDYILGLQDKMPELNNATSEEIKKKVNKTLKSMNLVRYDPAKVKEELDKE